MNVAILIMFLHILTGFTFGSLSWVYVFTAFVATKSLTPPFGKLMVCRHITAFWIMQFKDIFCI
jgi:hypothetical protein